MVAVAQMPHLSLADLVAQVVEDKVDGSQAVFLPPLEQMVEALVEDLQMDTTTPVELIFM